MSDHTTYIRGLRALADLLEQHPHLSLPYEVEVNFRSAEVCERGAGGWVIPAALLALVDVAAAQAEAGQLAQLTRLLSAQHGTPAPATDTTGGQAETAPKKPDEPRLMVGDIWETPADGEWQVTDRHGHLMLSRGDVSERYDFAEQRRGPLRLVQRAGYCHTETTVPVWQLVPGQVVSRPDWADGAPVRFVGTFDDVRDLKIIYWPLGGDARSIGTAARDAEATLWDEIAGGAR